MLPFFNPHHRTFVSLLLRREGGQRERKRKRERERERAPRDSQTDRRESMRETDTWKEKVRGTQRKQGAETEIHGAGGGGD